MSKIEVEDLYAMVFGTLAEDDDRRDEFLLAEKRLTDAYILVKHLDACRPYADEVTFYQRVRKQIKKMIPGPVGRKATVEQAVRDLVDDSIDSEGVVDIFAAAGIEKPDISILDDDFLQTFKNASMPNLRLKLLEKLMRDEIQLRERKNLAKYRSFREILEDTLRKYHNRTLDAAAVVEMLVRMRKEMEEDDRRVEELGLEPQEIAFYDAVAANVGQIYDQPFLCQLIHEVVQTLKRKLKPDWTKPHREDVQADVRAAVKLVLRRRKVKREHFGMLLGKIMEQAVALYAEWPQAA